MVTTLGVYTNTPADTQTPQFLECNITYVCLSRENRDDAAISNAVHSKSVIVHTTTSKGISPRDENYLNVTYVAVGMDYTRDTRVYLLTGYLGRKRGMPQYGCWWKPCNTTVSIMQHPAVETFFLDLSL